MNNLFQTIKSSRAIVVLLIVYLLITILVVALNAKEESKTSSKNSNSNTSETTNQDDNNTTNENDENLNSFLNDVNTLYADIKNYVSSNNTAQNTCIPISDITNNSTTSSGSILVISSTEFKVWYSNNSYVLNGVTLSSGSINESDIDYSFSTPYYNKCDTN